MNKDNPLIYLTMSAMMVVIASLTVMILLDGSRARMPQILHKTEVIRPIGSYPKIPDVFIRGTYRVHCKSVVSTYGVIQGTQEWSGSSFGIDMSEYGMPERRYVVTAAHVVLGEHPKPPDSIEIQIRTDLSKQWVKCKILALDKDRDLAILEVGAELPIVFKLADDCDVGNSIIVSGCPMDTTPSAVLGFLTSKDPEIVHAAVRCPIWQASAPFFLGNSGGPVFDAETHNVVAVLVAGLRTVNDTMVPNLALCIPCTEVRKFLDKAFRLPDEDDIVVAPPPKIIAVPPPDVVPTPPVEKPQPPKIVSPAPPKADLPKAEIVPLPGQK